uniref:Uncharacterized protein n=1 Tax=Arion vulgaris TaxID=1028688 RepID=A0A0B6ZYH4_9EUPU
MGRKHKHSKEDGRVTKNEIDRVAQMTSLEDRSTTRIYRSLAHALSDTMRSVNKDGTFMK